MAAAISPRRTPIFDHAEAIMQDVIAPHPAVTYRSAVRAGWQILRQHFPAILGPVLLWGLAILGGFLVLGIAMGRNPANADLWRFPLYLWANVLMMGLFRIFGAVHAGQPWRWQQVFWALPRTDAWTLALIPAALSALLVALSGFPQPGAAPLTLGQIHWPDLIAILVLSYLVTTLFQYAFARYAHYEDSPKIAIRQALRIFGDRFVWLWFPLVLGLAVMLVLLTVLIITSLLFDLAMMALHGFLGADATKAVFMMTVSLVILATMLPCIPILYGAIVVAAGALGPEGRPEGRPEPMTRP
ncbi:MAG: hypothetical protein M1488_02695 [Gammaproteobacteria bacterium]|nr:hypothetical protein [Gammaproteobacteria bacterium]